MPSIKWAQYQHFWFLPLVGQIMLIQLWIFYSQTFILSKKIYNFVFFLENNPLLYLFAKKGINKSINKFLLLRPFTLWLLQRSPNQSGFKILTKGHSLCKQCLHDLLFNETKYLPSNLSKLARDDISCQFKKSRYLCRHFLKNKWTLGTIVYSYPSPTLFFGFSSL